MASNRARIWLQFGRCGLVFPIAAFCLMCDSIVRAFLMKVLGRDCLGTMYVRGSRPRGCSLLC